jgi:hypothetical protein
MQELGAKPTLLRIPNLASIFDGLIFQVLAQLDLEQVLCVMLLVEILQPSVKDIRAVCGFDRLIIELLLCLGVGDKTILDDIVAKTVGSLGILPCGFEMGVANRIPRLLQLGVLPGLELLIQFGLIVPVLDPQVDDFSGDLSIGQVERGRGVELDILGRNVLARIEEFAMDIEDLHGKASWLRDAVLHER